MASSDCKLSIPADLRHLNILLDIEKKGTISSSIDPLNARVNVWEPKYTGECVGTLTNQPHFGHATGQRETMYDGGGNRDNYDGGNDYGSNDAFENFEEEDVIDQIFSKKLERVRILERMKFETVRKLKLEATFVEDVMHKFLQS